jgi:hypothetical protein
MVSQALHILTFHSNDETMQHYHRPVLKTLCGQLAWRPSENFYHQLLTAQDLEEEYGLT